jgi:tetratricopeptide (TPR) repeat protein
MVQPTRKALMLRSFAVLVTIGALTLNCVPVRDALAHNGPDETGPAVGAEAVAFENSGAAAAQNDFLHGLAQLHNFQYDAAAEAFRRAQQIDPSFAMAYWGEAMTYDHPVWVEEDVAAARKALSKLAPDPAARRAKAETEREKAYLDAVEVLFGDGSKTERDRRYSLAMERVHRSYPTDIDATCFYALSLLGTAQGIRDIPLYMRSAALMEEVFEQHPHHPGAAHYLIHSVDDAAHAPLGLRAANAYSKIAPASPHALHMTSHIYLALGMWQQTVAANEASTQLSERNFKLAHPDAPVPVCGHGKQWLLYAYLQQERYVAAREIVAACSRQMGAHSMPSVARDPYASEADPVSSYYAARSRFLIDSEGWDDPIAKIEADPLPLAGAAFRRAFTDAYMLLRQRSKVAAAAVMRAEHAADQLLAAGKQLGLADDYPSQIATGIERDELRGLLRWREGESDAALRLLADAAQREESLPMDYGPPSIYKPANELWGEVLLEMGKPDAAREAFEKAQRLAPGRTKSLLGLSKCAAALNDKELAASVDAKLEQTRREARTPTQQ